MINSRYWLPEVIGLCILGLASTLPFWWGTLDLTVASWFYMMPGVSTPWPLNELPIWRFLFWAAPWLTVVLGLTGLLILSVGILHRQRFRLRIYGMYIFLSVVVGPGLVVNAIFKDHWDRPRPREVQAFGGEEIYVSPLIPGERGNSFPCGHCSVGFAWAAFYLIWRRQYPIRATAALLASIILGSLMGVARWTAGGHFLSDVLWSAILTWSTLMLLYWPIMRVPWREVESRLGHSAPEEKTRTVAKLTLILLVAVTGVASTWWVY